MEYLVIVDMGNGFKIPLQLQAEDNAKALQQAVFWCNEQGYFATGLEIIRLHNSMGIVKVS